MPCWAVKWAMLVISPAGWLKPVKPSRPPSQIAVLKVEQDGKAMRAGFLAN